MMYFVLSLIVASIVGTLLWIIQSVIKPVTQKLFSQTWHYYSSLIPVFFVLGGTKIIHVFINMIDFGIERRNTEIIQKYNITNILNKSMTSFSQYEKISEITMWLISIWLLGVVVFISLSVINYSNYKKLILHNHRVCNTLQCISKVIISVNTSSPMVMGLINPVVILPDVQFKEEELAMILSHEITHIKRGDLLIKLVIWVAKAVHWFNPFIYLMNRQISDYCELSCDERVVQTMDTDSRKNYGEMILLMLDYGVNKNNRNDVACFCNLSNTKKHIKRRLLNIMNVKKMKKSVIAISVFVSILFVGIGTYAANSYESQVPNRIQSYAPNDDHSVFQVKEYDRASALTIEVEVPFRMKYQDPFADPPLNIDIQPGKQILTGDSAEAFLRFGAKKIQ